MNRSTEDAPTQEQIQNSITEFTRDEQAIRRSVEEVLVGQTVALEEILAVLLAGGHTLVEGVPGTGKTLLVRAIARATGLDFNRVQFTPDLLPADILGCDTLVMGEGSREKIEFAPGPIFTQFLLADEINRGTPRTQSALLEAMQEKSVTTSGHHHDLDALFTVFATRNPIEMEGTYPLPEAQLDRFLLEVQLPAPDLPGLVEIAFRTTGAVEASVETVLTPDRLAEMRKTVRQVIATESLLEYAARLISATQPESDLAPELVRESIRYGAGVRAVQALVLAGKVEALRAGRTHLACQDIDRYLLPEVDDPINLTTCNEKIEQFGLVILFLRQSQLSIGVLQRGCDLISFAKRKGLGIAQQLTGFFRRNQCGINEQAIPRRDSGEFFLSTHFSCFLDPTTFYEKTDMTAENQVV